MMGYYYKLAKLNTRLEVMNEITDEVRKLLMLRPDVVSAEDRIEILDMIREFFIDTELLIKNKDN